MNEIWKDIAGYEGYYQISNLGNVKTLAKEVNAPHKSKRFVPEQILKPVISRKGYERVQLQKARKKRTAPIHTLVWDAFGDRPRNGLKLLVDHIDENKRNNRIDNLQLLTNRENVRKSNSTRTYTSKYPNVYKNPQGLFVAQGRLNGKTVYLGRYEDEMLAYMRASRFEILNGQ